MYIKVVIPTILLAYNPLKILTCKNTKKLIHRQKFGLRFAKVVNRKSQTINRKKGEDLSSPLTATPLPCRHPPKGGTGGYFLTNAFVTTPLSVVTRTKYMPAARPETLI